VRPGQRSRIKQFLTSKGHPSSYLDLDRDAELRHCSIASQWRWRSDTCRDLPGGPTEESQQTRRSPIVSAFRRASITSPAGDVASWRRTSRSCGRRLRGFRGLDVLRYRGEPRLEGKAGSSSRIENYLGFQRGAGGFSLFAPVVFFFSFFAPYLGGRSLLPEFFFFFFFVVVCVGGCGFRARAGRAPYARNRSLRRGHDREGARVVCKTTLRRDTRASVTIHAAQWSLQPGPYTAVAANLCQFEGCGCLLQRDFMEAQLCEGR